MTEDRRNLARVRRWSGPLGIRGWALGLVVTACTVSCAATAPPPPAALLVSPVYQDAMLRPGDVLRLTVWRRDDLSGEFLVGPDSALVHPLLQEVEVVGVPLPEIKSRLDGYLRRFTGEPRTTLEPLFPVYVGGSVRSPALYQLPWGTTVSQAIQEAGGHTDEGRLDRVRFVRGGSDANLDLWDSSADQGAIWIRSGDALYVATGSSFNVFRDVLQPVAWLMSFTISILVLANRI